MSSISDTACPVWWIHALSNTTTLLGFEPSKGNNWGRRYSSINLQNSSSSRLLVVMSTSNTPSVQIAAIADYLLPLTSIFSAMAGVPLYVNSHTYGVRIVHLIRFHLQKPTLGSRIITKLQT